MEHRGTLEKVTLVEIYWGPQEAVVFRTGADRLKVLGEEIKIPQLVPTIIRRVQSLLT